MVAEDWFPYPVDRDARRDLAADKTEREHLRAAVGELSASWADICKHTPSTYTCGDWNRMSTAVESLIALIEQAR